MLSSVKPQTIQRLPASFCIERLQSLCLTIPQAFWNVDQRRQTHYWQHVHTESLVFQAITDASDVCSGTYQPIWRAWRETIAPVISCVATSYHYPEPETCRVMLVKLKAGQCVAPHRDVGKSFEHAHRIHVPVISSPGVRFLVGDDDCYLAPGHAYEINNLIRHAVMNASELDRVHLIFDLFDASSLGHAHSRLRNRRPADPLSD